MSIPLRFHTSLRVAPATETLSHAEQFAKHLGISRVTDITRLDFVDVPVCVSIRPLAHNLCINGGKGVLPIEARVGAYMEAIEHAVAERARDWISVASIPTGELLDGQSRSEAILDFCPVLGARFDLDAPMNVVDAYDIPGARTMAIPASLVFLPDAAHPPDEHFGSSANGLASGNTLEEATLHALLEVIERDIKSFNSVQDTAIAIAEDSLPACAQELLEKVHLADLRTCIRYVPNVFGLPFFETALWDPNRRFPASICGGWACHPLRDIALLRSLTEAIQARGIRIHGLKDDFPWHAQSDGRGAPDEGTQHLNEYVSALGAKGCRPFDMVPDHSSTVTTIASAQDLVIQDVLSAGIQHVCRIVLTPPEASIAVVRIVVPKLEFLSIASHRVGPRLARLLASRNS